MVRALPVSPPEEFHRNFRTLLPDVYDEWRLEDVSARRTSRYLDKTDWIRSLLGGRTALYVGSVEDDPENFRKHLAMQRSLEPASSSLLGVYHSAEQAAAVATAGLQGVHADVTDLHLDGEFDVIVAADVIEHISNCDAFLQGVLRHLAADGIFVVSTPNPTGLIRILELLAYGRVNANIEHVAWYSGQVLDQMVRRHGMAVRSEVWVDDMRQYHRTDDPARPLGIGKRVLTRLVVAANRPTCALFPQLSETCGFVVESER